MAMRHAPTATKSYFFFLGGGLFLFGRAARAAGATRV
jgi:hypothetical protein